MVNAYSSLLVEFGTGGNDSEFLLEGWSGPEPTHRWAIGGEAQIKFGLVVGAPAYNLTIRASVVPIPLKHVQVVLIVLNNLVTRRVEMQGESNEYSIVLPREMFRFSEENVMQFFFSHSSEPYQLNKLDGRALSVAFQRLVLEDSGFAPFETARLLPLIGKLINDKKDLQALGESFQSLGQNCEFGLWQRRCGAEPLGLLRFASIYVNKLLYGIRTGFIGIDDSTKLKFVCNREGGEYMGHHDFYGLDYHTFKNQGEVDLDKFSAKEPMRLRFLANMLMDQIKLADKVFVVQRGDRGFNLDQVLPVFLALRAHNSEIKLLYITSIDAKFPALRGRVEIMADGLYQGFVSKLAPGQNAHDMDYPSWLKVCSTVSASVQLQLNS